MRWKKGKNEGKNSIWYNQSDKMIFHKMKQKSAHFKSWAKRKSAIFSIKKIFYSRLCANNFFFSVQIFVRFIPSLDLLPQFPLPIFIMLCIRRRKILDEKFVATWTHFNSGVKVWHWLFQQIGFELFFVHIFVVLRLDSMFIGCFKGD